MAADSRAASLSFAAECEVLAVELSKLGVKELKVTIKLCSTTLEAPEGSGAGTAGLAGRCWCVLCALDKSWPDSAILSELPVVLPQAGATEKEDQRSELRIVRSF